MSEDSIVMELIDGGSLRDLLHDKNVELDWNRKLHLAKQACQAINFLHNREKPILHRDLKSLNFLVSKDDIVKLIDFGISKIKSTFPKISTRSESRLVGSVRWMAGETAAKEYQWTTKADIFALGMVLYEIASRKLPFENVQEDLQVIILIKYEKDRPNLPSDTPPFFAKIITKCWEHDPTERPNSEEVLNWITECIQLFPQEDSQPRSFFQVKKEDPKNMTAYENPRKSPSPDEMKPNLKGKVNSFPPSYTDKSIQGDKISIFSEPHVLPHSSKSLQEEVYTSTTTEKTSNIEKPVNIEQRPHILPGSPPPVSTPAITRFCLV
eukprot:TRINITY_DN6782_c0_g1_i2.p1 TRINITY_DN6782_c0_g1~~TRINITY_DN6782_c0_g1_i2.p1  ORF type:complete len:324 (-),score=57.38 TRINITY_DN6782_c0_g1_i2:324-1295(-)